MNIKKQIILAVLFLGAAIVTVFYAVRYPQFFARKNRQATVVQFPQHNIAVSVEVARDPYAWSKGLMFRESLPDDAGMLFVFPDEAPRSFWMKHTLIPLDMLFISADKRVVSIVRGATPCTTLACPTYASDGKAMYVLEVNAGLAEQYGISIGDVVIFDEK